MYQKLFTKYFLNAEVLSIMTVSMLLENIQAKVSRIVNTESGIVRGYQDPHFDIFAFYGIPYATNPIGVNKFKAPLPAPVWSEKLEAVDKGIICPQYATFKRKTMKEECLIANVYVPYTYATSLPVMVQIHGGGFQQGYGNILTPKNLVNSKRIIVVNFNYRLGAHGFLCLGTKNVPGNAGMKDQVALLQWVKRNIASFGGNPDDVTISGYSAGASAAGLLMLSKTARGLFSKVVVESGAAIAVWSVQMFPLQVAQNYAKQLNYDKSNGTYALEEFYKKTNIQKLNMHSAYKHDFVHGFGFVPCVERPTGGEVMFLDDSPFNIMKNGNYDKLPVLYSVSSNEWNGDIPNAEHILPADLKFENQTEKQNVTQEIRKFYSKDEAYTYDTYLGDVSISYPLLREVKLHIEAGNTKIYLYEYSYGNNGHCAQSEAIADDYNENLFSEEFKKVKADLRKIMINFITTGIPVRAESMLPAWGTVMSTEGGPHMSISNVMRLQGPPPQSLRARFWNTVYDKHYRMPAPPYKPPSLNVMQQVR